MRIGVVIPCRGDRSLLAACLASLAPFVHADDAVVVVDANVEADNAVSLITQLNDVFYHHSTDVRRGAAIAAGVTWLLHEQSIDLILICHADMILHHAARAGLLTTLGAHTRTRWGCLGHRIIDHRLRFRLLEWGNRFRGTVLNIPYGDQAMFVGVDLLMQAGGWPPQPVLEDLELSLRLRDLTVATFIDAPVTISSRHWANGVCRATIRNWMLAARYIIRRRWPKLRSYR